MEPNPRPASDPEQAKLEVQREYASEYRARHRGSRRVAPEELPLFQDDPLREEKLSRRETEWKKVIVCRLCGFKAGRLINHLKVFHRIELSDGSEATATFIANNYRKRFGYNKRQPLSCAELREKYSQKLKGRNSRRRWQGRPSVGQGTRFKKKRAATPSGIHRGVEARKEWGTSQQAKQRMSASRKGRPNIKNRKRRNATGEVVATASDWQRARLRLAGKELSQIAKFRANANGKELTVREASELLGVPEPWIYAHTRQSSKDSIPHSKTERGALTFLKDQLLDYAQDRRHGVSSFLTTSKLETELAGRLGISARRVYGFVAHPESYKNPLPITLGERLLSSIASLREEFRQLGSTAKGGRPKTLLPSEGKELPGKYDTLKSDLNLMLSWAERLDDGVKLEEVGKWMCEQSGLGRLQVLLFWPSLHEKLSVICERARNRDHGGRLGAAERSKEILCQEYRISPRQLARAVTLPSKTLIAA